MKKLLIASAISAGLLGASVAHAETGSVLDNWQENAYGQAKLGFTDMGLSDSAMTITGVAGLKTPSIHPMLSFEADLTFTVTDAETSVSSMAGNTKVTASAFSLGAYAVASYDQLSIENLVPYVRAGLGYTSVEVKASNAFVSASGDDSEIDLGLGAGVRYQINDQLGVLVDYTTISALDTLNVGVQYSF